MATRNVKLHYMAHNTLLPSPNSFFFCLSQSIWKFPGQGWDPHHSSDPSLCSDNARSLTCCTTRELLLVPFLYCLLDKFVISFFTSVSYASEAFLMPSVDFDFIFL